MRQTHGDHGAAADMYSAAAIYYAAFIMMYCAADRHSAAAMCARLPVAEARRGVEERLAPPQPAAALGASLLAPPQKRAPRARIGD
jgi:hypothetical protein